jgi:tetratricopeptide (TPR) repeat protein
MPESDNKEVHGIQNTDMINEENNPDPEKEAEYQNLVRMTNVINCMVSCTQKMEMYQNIADRFSKLSGYTEADRFAKESRHLASLTKQDMYKATYKNALKKKNSATNSKEYGSAAEDFRKITGYRDSDALAKECENLSKRLNHKKNYKKVFKYGLISFCIIAFFIGISTSHAKYYLAGAYRVTGAYDSAIELYQKLGKYKNSEENLIECQYKKAMKLVSNKEYNDAVVLLSECENYKDSEEQKLTIEKQAMKDSKIGKTVTLGNCKWIILDRIDDQVFLMKKEALKERPYHTASGIVTWENSSLRQWLNSTFISKTFSQSEQRYLLSVLVKNNDNATYGTDGGNDTQDLIYIMDIQEAEQYKTYFPEFKSSSWLRSPGNNQSSAAFLSASGSVMDYGYDTTSEEFTVRPVLWFNIN